MAILYVAGMPISDNIKDISHKTLDIIKKSHIVIGEERAVALKLLNSVESKARLFLINEHTGDKERLEILKEVEKSEISTFFSDCGTPCISDPDYKFIKLCRDKGVVVKSLPGPSSITSAISISGINARTFLFAGFPPRKDNERRDFFKNIEKSNITQVFMERPYALSKTLKDMSFFKRKISISLNLDCDNEATYYDYPRNLLKKLDGIKAPFVVVVEGK